MTAPAWRERGNFRSACPRTCASRSKLGEAQAPADCGRPRCWARRRAASRRRSSASACRGDEGTSRFRERGVALDARGLGGDAAHGRSPAASSTAMRTDARAARNAALIARGRGAGAGGDRARPDRTFQAAGESRGVEARRASPAAGRSTARRSRSGSRTSLLKSTSIPPTTSCSRGCSVNAGLSDEEAASFSTPCSTGATRIPYGGPTAPRNAEYAQAGLKGRPANYPFQSTEELQLVLGMRPELYQRIAPMITVYSRQPGVNPHLASRAVLLAIPGVTAEAGGRLHRRARRGPARQAHPADLHGGGGATRATARPAR